VRQAAKVFTVEPRTGDRTHVGTFMVATYNVARLMQVTKPLGGQADLSDVAEGPSTITCDHFKSTGDTDLAALLAPALPLELEVVQRADDGQIHPVATFGAVQPVGRKGNAVIFEGIRTGP